MGLLDGLFGDLMGSAPGGGQNREGNNPLDSILNGLGGGNQRQSSSLLMAVMALIQQSGGLGQIMEKLRGSGMAAQADSWVGTGANLNISSDQISQIFGASTLNNVAAQHGIPQNEFGNALSQLLPEVVNQMSPQGSIPDNHGDILSKALGMLGGR